jgi:hypothetical protein
MSSTHDVSAVARNLQVIVIGLLSGAVLFGAVSIVISDQIAPPMPNLPILSYLAIGMTVIDVMARFIIVRMLDAKARSVTVKRSSPTAADISAESWPMAYQTRTIISAAMIEGCLFFCLIAFMLEGQMATLILAGLLLAALLAHVPTTGRIEAWIRRQREIIEMETVRTF